MKAKSVLAQEMWGKIKQGEQDYWFVARRLRDRTFCIERYPKPSYTRTSAQDQQRNKFKNAVNAWNALSPSEKEQWNQNAEPFGLTGYQYFIQQYLLAPPPAEIWYKVTIDNTANSNTLTDYQILINIQNDEQFFNDCQDKREAIRLFDTDKETSLSYWIEEWDTTNHNAKIWVKVPSIPGSGTKTIYISVDPNRTTDNSDGDATFIFFDDFEGTSLDTSKWYVYDGNGGTVSDSILTLNCGDGGSDKIHSKTYFSPGVRYRSKSYHKDVRAEGFMEESSHNGNYNGDLAIYADNPAHTRVDVEDDGGNQHVVSVSITREAWNIYEIRWLSDKLTILENGEKLDPNMPYTTGIPDGSPEIPIYYDVYSEDSNPLLKIDYVFVTKYADPEPTVSYEKE